VHESQDGIDVRFVHLAPDEFRVFVVFYTVSETPESPVRLEFHLQKARQLTILEAPEILATMHLTRHETSPKGALDEALEVFVRLDKTVRIEFRPEGDGSAVLGTTKNPDCKLIILVLAIPSN
jgi:hypothetical protein